jgi:hypothetical protein
MPSHHIGWSDGDACMCACMPCNSDIMVDPIPCLWGPIGCPVLVGFCNWWHSKFYLNILSELLKLLDPPVFFLLYPICEGIWNMLNLLLRAFRGTWGGVGVGATTPQKKNWDFLNPTKNYCMSCLILKKTLHLHSWRSLVHISHIECTSPSRFRIQFICVLPLNK